MKVKRSYEYEFVLTVPIDILTYKLDALHVLAQFPVIGNNLSKRLRVYCQGK